MRTRRVAARAWAFIVWFSLAALFGYSGLVAAQAKPGLDNDSCLSCHGTKAAKIEVPGAADKPRAVSPVAADKFSKGVHGKLQCVDCHSGITQNPPPGGSHASIPDQKLRPDSCADCHQKLWDEAKKNNTAASKPRLGVVVENALAYKDSFHARPRKNDPNRAVASCNDCHNTHTFDIPPKASPEFQQWRLKGPEMCGTCHDEALEYYGESVHGKAVLEKDDPKAAICSDCHTSHSIGNTSASPVKLAITAQCGSCHTAEYEAYKATYHGKISTLGYTHTAKCYECHGSHEILPVDDPDSKVSPENRLETCESCHDGDKAGVAPASFLTFQPHARTDDFDRYPQVWLAFRLMIGLLVGTFAFFWLHSALWFYRELKERKQAKLRPHVTAEAIPPALQGKHFKRFSATWRIAHITFALSLMVLTLTGMPLFYPDSAWAPSLMEALGGPQVAGTIHRVSAVIFAGVFLWHLFYVGGRLWRERKTFRIFGPTSMIPGPQDLFDIIAMFKWFFGLAPRPVFDRWTYWEKFDYWAPFWGVTIIGVSGLVMWLPSLTGSILPGWIFNVAAIFHGEEAFLAVVFLFTVHFFNNHFRPDKFPVEVVMFTGTMPLEHYIHEHPLEYKRLRDSGELDKYIVDAPSAPMNSASRLLGFVLIAIGLTLLFGVAVGFFGGH